MAVVTPAATLQDPANSRPDQEPRWLLNSRHRITVEEYHRILEANALGIEPRVELLEGVIVEKMTKNPPHNLACDLVQHILSALLPRGYFLSMGTPMTIEEHQGEPEPDAWVLRGERRDYAARRRTPADAALVIEVADTSYGYARFQKALTYAASGIPTYWIVDLNHRRLEVHSDPGGEGAEAYYAQTRIHGEEEAVPLVLDGRPVGSLVVREILP